MKNARFLLPFLCLLLGCSKAPVTMTSFKIIDKATFEMCFDQEVEGMYSLVIRTKAGREIKKVGQLRPVGVTCFREKKMQFSQNSYSEAQRQFLNDSLMTDNIVSVQWVISRRHYERPIAEGIFQK